MIYYLVHVLIGLFNMDKFTPVANDIRKFDEKLLGTKLRDEIPVSRLFFLTFLVIRITTHSSYCYFYRCNTYIFFYDVTLFISHFPRIMMFELLWHRMALIRKHFELKFSAHRVENGGENVKEVIRSCLITYKSLLDTLQQSYAVVKPLVTKCFLFYLSHYQTNSINVEVCLMFVCQSRNLAYVFYNLCIFLSI